MVPTRQGCGSSSGGPGFPAAGMPPSPICLLPVSGSNGSSSERALCGQTWLPGKTVLYSLATGKGSLQIQETWTSLVPVGVPGNCSLVAKMQGVERQSALLSTVYSLIIVTRKQNVNIGW